MMFYAKLTLKLSDVLEFLMTLKLNNMLDSESLFWISRKHHVSSNFWTLQYNAIFKNDYSWENLSWL